MTAIGALVAEVRRAHEDETGVELSYGDIARRSRGSGEGKGLSRGRVQQIATAPIKRMPDRETIDQLARGLRVPASVVVERYMESVGVDQRQRSPATRDVADLLARDPTLSEASRAHIINQYRLLQQLSRLEVPADEGQDVDEQAIRGSRTMNDAQKSEALEALWERRGQRRQREQSDDDKSGERRDAR